MLHSDLHRIEVVAKVATSFLSEGYLMQVSFKSVSLCYFKLRHKSNGNRIEVHAEPNHNWLEVTKNGKRIKSGNITD